MMILNHELKLKYTMRVKFAYVYLIIISIIHNSMIVFKNFRGLVAQQQLAQIQSKITKLFPCLNT